MVLFLLPLSLLAFAAFGVLGQADREPIHFIWDTQRVRWIWLRPREGLANWGREALRIERRLSPSDARALGASEGWISVLKFQSGQWRTPLFGVPIPWGPCADYEFRLIHGNGSESLPQALPPPDIRLRQSSGAGFGLATNRISYSLAEENALNRGAGGIVARFHFGRALSTGYGVVVEQRPWLREESCANIKRERLPQPRRLSTQGLGRDSVEYSVDARYLRYDCRFVFGLNYTVELSLPGQGSTSRRPSCRREFEVDAVAFRLDCRDPLFAAFRGFVCAEPRRVCDADCAPSRVWHSVEYGLPNQLAPATRRPRLVANWTFGAAEREFGVRSYQVRWYQSQLADDGSLLRHLSPGESVQTRPGVRGIRFPISLDQAEANYSIQVCAMREDGCENRLDWSQERLYPIRFRPESDVRALGVGRNPLRLPQGSTAAILLTPTPTTLFALLSSLLLLCSL